MTGPIIAIARIAIDIAAKGEVEVYVPILGVDKRKEHHAAEPVKTGLRFTCSNDCDVPMAVDLDISVRPDPDE